MIEAIAMYAEQPPAGVNFTWTLGSFWQLHGIVELYEAPDGSNFASATKVWEGRGSGVTLKKPAGDITTRRYWIRMRTIGGQVSAEFPSGTGVAGAALRTPTAGIDPGAISERYIEIEPGPVTMSATGTIAELAISPSHAGELVISSQFLTDTSNISSGSQGWRLELIQGGTTVPVHSWTIVNTPDPDVNFHSGPARVNANAGAATLRLQMVTFDGGTSMDFSQITFDVVLLKR